MEALKAGQRALRVKDFSGTAVAETVIAADGDGLSPVPSASPVAGVVIVDEFQTLKKLLTDAQGQPNAEGAEVVEVLVKHAIALKATGKGPSLLLATTDHFLSGVLTDRELRAQHWCCLPITAQSPLSRDCSWRAGVLRGGRTRQPDPAARAPGV
jgi:hypothetical protein